MDGILVYGRRSFFWGKPREFRHWCQIKRLRLKAIPVEEGRVGIVVEQGRNVARLPVDDARNPFGIMRVYEDIVTVQIIMPEAGAVDSSVLWDKGIDDLSVPC